MKQPTQPILKIAETPEANVWLNQFSGPEDRDLAKFLLNSLDLVSHDQFQNEIRKLVQLKVKYTNGPIALYVAREVKDGEMFFCNLKNRPSVVVNNDQVGSEGDLATLATQMSRPDPKRVRFNPPLQTLKPSLKRNREACRELVILDDISASGNRIKDFIHSMLKERHLRSWFSLGWIKFHVIAFALTERAENVIIESLKSRMRRTKPIKRSMEQRVTFSYFRRPPTGPDQWSHEVHDRVKSLCKRHCPKLASQSAPLGYKQIMGLLIFSHSCPNYAPGILWQRSRSWNPLFPERTIPHGLARIFGSPTSAIPVITPAMERLGASQIREFLDWASPSVQNMLLILAAARKRVRDRNQLLLWLRLPAPEFDRSRNRCLELGLLDSHGYLTAGGISVLHDAEKVGKLPFKPPTLRNSEYFPTQLRGARA